MKLRLTPEEKLELSRIVTFLEKNYIEAFKTVIDNDDLDIIKTVFQKLTRLVCGSEEEKMTAGEKFHLIKMVKILEPTRGNRLLLGDVFKQNNKFLMLMNNLEFLAWN